MDGVRGDRNNSIGDGGVGMMRAGLCGGAEGDKGGGRRLRRTSAQTEPNPEL